MSQPGTPMDDRQVAAIAALYQSEISANVGELQATTTIVFGLLAYLAATIFAIDQVGPVPLTLLPLGVLFGCAYQMLRAAVVMRRASVARSYEGRLAEIAGFSAQYQQRALGSGFYGSLDDIGIIMAARERGWVAKAAVAGFAYAGLYILAFGYTAVVVWRLWNVTGGADWTAVTAAVYLAAWLAFGCVAFGYLLKPVAAASL